MSARLSFSRDFTDSDEYDETNPNPQSTRLRRPSFLGGSTFASGHRSKFLTLDPASVERIDKTTKTRRKPSSPVETEEYDMESPVDDECDEPPELPDEDPEDMFYDYDDDDDDVFDILQVPEDLPPPPQEDLPATPSSTNRSMSPLLSQTSLSHLGPNAPLPTVPLVPLGESLEDSDDYVPPAPPRAMSTSSSGSTNTPFFTQPTKPQTMESISSVPSLPSGSLESYEDVKESPRGSQQDSGRDSLRDSGRLSSTMTLRRSASLPTATKNVVTLDSYILPEDLTKKFLIDVNTVDEDVPERLFTPIGSAGSRSFNRSPSINVSTSPTNSTGSASGQQSSKNDSLGDSTNILPRTKPSATNFTHHRRNFSNGSTSPVSSSEGVCEPTAYLNRSTRSRDMRESTTDRDSEPDTTRDTGRDSHFNSISDSANSQTASTTASVSTTKLGVRTNSLEPVEDDEAWDVVSSNIPRTNMGTASHPNYIASSTVPVSTSGFATVKFGAQPTKASNRLSLYTTTSEAHLNALDQHRQNVFIKAAAIAAAKNGYSPTPTPESTPSLLMRSGNGNGRPTSAFELEMNSGPSVSTASVPVDVPIGSTPIILHNGKGGVEVPPSALRWIHSTERSAKKHRRVQVVRFALPPAQPGHSRKRDRDGVSLEHIDVVVIPRIPAEPVPVQIPVPPSVVARNSLSHPDINLLAAGLTGNNVVEGTPQVEVFSNSEFASLIQPTNHLAARLQSNSPSGIPPIAITSTPGGGQAIITSVYHPGAIIPANESFEIQVSRSRQAFARSIVAPHGHYTGKRVVIPQGKIRQSVADTGSMPYGLLSEEVRQANVQARKSKSLAPQKIPDNAIPLCLPLPYSTTGLVKLSHVVEVSNATEQIRGESVQENKTKKRGKEEGQLSSVSEPDLPSAHGRNNMRRMSSFQPQDKLTPILSMNTVEDARGDMYAQLSTPQVMRSILVNPYPSETVYDISCEMNGISSFENYCLARLQQGCFAYKIKAGKLTRRFLFLGEDLNSLCWRTLSAREDKQMRNIELQLVNPTKIRNTLPTSQPSWGIFSNIKSISVSDIYSVYYGPYFGKDFKRYAMKCDASEAKSWLALSVETRDETLNLIFTTVQDATNWAIGLQILAPANYRSFSLGKMLWMRVIMKVNHIGFSNFVQFNIHDWSAELNKPGLVEL